MTGAYLPCYRASGPTDPCTVTKTHGKPSPQKGQDMDYRKIREDNLARLLTIRDADETPPAVQIQAIQSIQKILAEVAPPAEETAATGKSILAKIRGDES